MRTWALALLFAVSFTFQADACVFDRFVFFYGDKNGTSTKMRVEKGKLCIIIMGTTGQSRYDSVRITKQARNGISEIGESNTPRYRSRPNFTGQDDFTVTICGKSLARTGCTDLRVQVTVD